MRRTKREKWLALILTFIITVSVLSPGLYIYAEAANHRHTTECYSDEGELLCGIEEGAAHERTGDNDVGEQALTCQKEDGEHIHTDECYAEDGGYTCGGEIVPEPENESSPATCSLTQGCTLLNAHEGECILLSLIHILMGT